MAKSLNKVLLIGNLTRDPEMRYTPSGSAVCTFSIATNRQWNNETGEKKEEVEYHRIVAWSKLGEICGQLLTKGRKVYVEGRLQTRKWSGQDGVEKSTTEIVINDMVLLDAKGAGAPASGSDFDIPDDLDAPVVSEDVATPKKSVKKEDVGEAVDDDIPF